MHDGASAYFSQLARHSLDIMYPRRWIGRSEPYSWPPKSSDLNPLDFFLWGHLKTLVYETSVHNINDLRERIIAGCNVIQATPQIFLRVRNSLRRRAENCIIMGGNHVQILLYIVLQYLRISLVLIRVIKYYLKEK